MKCRNNDQELREKFPVAPSGTELRSTKQLSQDQLSRERWTDEHKSLPHFSFLLFKVDCILDLQNLRIPQQ